MDWRLQIASGLEHFGPLHHLQWLVAATTTSSLLLLLALLVVSVRYRRLRHRLAPGDKQLGRNLPAAGLSGEAPSGPIIAASLLRPLIDRVFPRRRQNFLLFVVIFATACWLLGLYLTTNVQTFLASPEWRLQPFYLAAHVITLRLITTVFTRNFMAGVAHLDMPPAQACRAMGRILGPVGGLVALCLAAPFCVYDFPVLFAVNGDLGRVADVGRTANQLLFGMWCLEWFLMSLIWVLLIGFLILTYKIIGKQRFRSPIELVLLEKQYRPFLQMSAQGATIVLGFCVVNAGYTWYTNPEISDYIGVGITLVLLVVGFVPPWMQLKAKVDRAVREEMAALRRRLADGMSHTHRGGDRDQPQAVRELEGRLDEALAMLRISYLDRLYRHLGQTEATSVLLKLLVAATTIGLSVLRYFNWVL